MAAGRYRHPVTIKSLVVTQDATTGVVTEAWSDFATVRASFEPLSVREFMNADMRKAEVVARIQMRFLDGVTPTMRLAHEGKTYEVTSVLPDPKSGRQWITLLVREVVNG